jgi:hypothetical protein
VVGLLIGCEDVWALKFCESRNSVVPIGYEVGLDIMTIKVTFRLDLSTRFQLTTLSKSKVM